MANTPRKMVFVTVPCDRCNGLGQLPQFMHVAEGTCFKCGGKTTVDRWLPLEVAKTIPGVKKAVKKEEAA